MYDHGPFSLMNKSLSLLMEVETETRRIRNMLGATELVDTELEIEAQDLAIFLLPTGPGCCAATLERM